MTKRLFLHVGTEKTGSKAIQKCISENSQAIDEAGLKIFPDGWNGTWHRDFYENFGSKAGLARVTKELEKAGQIITYESGYKFVAVLEQLYSLNPEILVFVRHPFDWLNSYGNQLIKAHRTSAQEVDAWLDGSSCFGPLDALVGFGQSVRHNELVKITALRYSEGTNSVPAFLKFAGLEGKGLQLPKRGTNVNPALNEFGLRLFYQLKCRLRGQTKEKICLQVEELRHFCSRRDIQVYCSGSEKPMVLSDHHFVGISGYFSTISKLFGLDFKKSVVLGEQTVVDPKRRCAEVERVLGLFEGRGS